jgi:hypothetical protein
MHECVLRVGLCAGPLADIDMLSREKLVSIHAYAHTSMQNLLYAYTRAHKHARAHAHINTHGHTQTCTHAHTQNKSGSIVLLLGLKTFYINTHTHICIQTQTHKLDRHNKSRLEICKNRSDNLISFVSVNTVAWYAYGSSQSSALLSYLESVLLRDVGVHDNRYIRGSDGLQRHIDREIKEAFDWLIIFRSSSRLRRRQCQ